MPSVNIVICKRLNTTSKLSQSDSPSSFAKHTGPVESKETPLIIKVSLPLVLQDCIKQQMPGIMKTVSNSSTQCKINPTWWEPDLVKVRKENTDDHRYTGPSNFYLSIQSPDVEEIFTILKSLNSIVSSNIVQVNHMSFVCDRDAVNRISINEVKIEHRFDVCLYVGWLDDCKYASIMLESLFEIEFHSLYKALFHILKMLDEDFKKLKQPNIQFDVRKDERSGSVKGSRGSP